QCAQRAAELRHEVAVRKQAVGIAEAVRRRMIQKVLPQTTQNMRQLLPLLTLDRYHDCEITPDYKLLIYDDTANRTVAKNVFSGGARDQFSLALRLAFALATLPEELGTTPGFIFLDEPLSSFDGPRSEALVNLLTRGQIHDNFEQLFVISHNMSFDRGAFTHHLRLEYGAVVESTLPKAT
nr:SMC family ATPase [Ktedonobacterales bacterium]